MPLPSKFHYHNSEKRVHKGKHITRRVYIKNGKGYKSITTQKQKGGKRRITKKILNPREIEHIKNRKFIKGLFSDCKK
jgi:hypothetical protein